MAPSLIKLIVRAHRFKAQLLQSAGSKFADLARREQLNRSYYARVLRLSYLAPDITRAIFEGRQPSRLTARTLLGCSDLPSTGRRNARRLGSTEIAGARSVQIGTRLNLTARAAAAIAPAFFVGDSIKPRQRYLSP